MGSRGFNFGTYIQRSKHVGRVSGFIERLEISYLVPQFETRVVTRREDKSHECSIPGKKGCEVVDRVRPVDSRQRCRKTAGEQLSRKANSIQRDSTIGKGYTSEEQREEAGGSGTEQGGLGSEGSQSRWENEGSI